MQHRIFSRSMRGLIFAFISVGVFFLPGLAAAQQSIRDTEIEAILREWTDPILDAAGLEREAVSIYIIDDNSLNAFVAGGQNIFLNTGIILKSETPNELIGVIAHETGHISGGHIVRTSDAISAAYRPMILTLGLGALAIAAGAPEAGMAIMTGGQHIAQQTFLKHSRTQEAAADQAAVIFLEQTEQSSAGLITFFERFRHNEVLSYKRQDPYFRTHPLSSDRIANLRVKWERSKHKDAQDSELRQKQLDMMKAKIFGFLSDPATTFNHYPKSDQSLPAKYARAIAGYKAAQMEKAEILICELIDTDPDNPYYQELLGQALFESGQVTRSIEPHRRALDLALGAPLLQVNLAHALIESEDQENLTEAEALLQQALAKENDLSVAWHLLSMLHGKRGKPALAKWATAERYYSSRDLPMARRFAKLALEELQENSIPWRRANDIVLVADTDMRDRPRAWRNEPRQRR